MSDPKQERDSDRDSLTGWTLVDHEGTPEDSTQDDETSPPDGDETEGDADGAGGVEEVEEEAEEESGCGMEEEEAEEEEEEPLPDDLVTMGQKVQEIKGESIKAPSGSDSSDIETLECPSSEEYLEEDHNPFDSLHSSLLSSSSLTGFTFVGGSEEGDVESLASTDISILDEEGKEKEKPLDEETDLSLASSPSLPDDLPAIKPDTQYKHTPDKELNNRLNVVVALTLACVLGLGLGHFLGWSSRTMWQENLNSAQVRRLRELQNDLVSCMSAPPLPSSHPASLESPNQYRPDAEIINNDIPEPSSMTSNKMPEPELESDNIPESLIAALESDNSYTESDFIPASHSDDINYPESSFIPVLPENNGDDALHIDSFVESIVMPLEDAGVILSPSRKQSEAYRLRGTHSSIDLESTDPTFATPDILYRKSNMIPLADRELGNNMEGNLGSSVSESSTTTSNRDSQREDKFIEMAFSLKQVPSIENNVPLLSSESQGSASHASVSSSETDPYFESWPNAELPLPPHHQASPSPPHSPPEATYQAAEEEDLNTDSSSPLTVDAVQIIEALTTENKHMEAEIARLQHETIAPIKIGGKEGKMSRELRERINHLILDNEELRMAVGKLQFATVPEGDKEAFNLALKNNYNLRIAVSKLTHLGPNLSDLKVSANDLQGENEELQIQVGKLRYQEQPLPQELNAVAREIENLKKNVKEAVQQKKVPPGLDNARVYISYMSQILSGIQTLHEFGEGSAVEKLNVATDVFENLVPGNVKLPPATQEKMNVVRTKFAEIRVALANKWDKVKELSRPETIVSVGRDTLTKMNRVIVNVVNKMKEIGQTSIMNRGKTSVEKTVTTLAESFTALGAQFDRTWDTLEKSVVAKEEDHVATVPEDSESVTIQSSSVVEEAEVEEKEAEVAVEKTLKEEEESAEGEVEKVIATSGRGGKEGGDGEDKKKPDDKSNVKTVKKEEKKRNKEKKEAEKQERRQQRSRRNRIRSSEEKEDKENKADGKQRESKKQGDEKAKQVEKKGKSKDGHEKTPKPAGKKSEEENKKYYKDQYNKYDKRRHHHSDDDDDNDDDDRHHYKKYQKKHDYDDDDDDNDHKYRKKHHKSRHDDDDDDDDDNKRSWKQNRGKRNHDDDDDDEDDRKKGLKRHWQQPSRKNYHREYTGPKKAFIRRRGKNQTEPYYHSHQQGQEWTRGSQRSEGRARDVGEQKAKWMTERAKNRNQRREEERKADWQFDRARERNNRREKEQMAEWQFDRARDRSNLRQQESVSDWVFERAGDRNNRRGKNQAPSSEHDNYEHHESRRRYVRFEDDDDDDDYDDDDDDDYIHYQQQHGRGKYSQRKQEYLKKKGQREWVIPNLSASGKAFYR